ncbi:MAG: preprotein translocase subunit SecG [Succinatimonas hippei]|nr:preprotein translocase subunit SecG [Succinatimonas hippei]
MYEVAIVIFLLVCVALVALILVQQGKGAGMGASFGQGASQTVFGSVGSGNFLTRSTWFLILLFFAICLLIGWMQKSAHETNTSDFSNIGAGAAQTEQADQKAPAAPSTDAPATDAPVAGGSESSGTDAPAK